MSSAYFPVMIAALLPLLLAAIAKAGGMRKGVHYDNATPRESLARLQGWPQRANWAQQNSWEGFPVFAAAVLMAMQAGADPQQVSVWAWAYVGLRLAYALCYLADFAAMRSLCWAVGFAVCLRLMWMAF